MQLTPEQEERSAFLRKLVRDGEFKALYTTERPELYMESYIKTSPDGTASATLTRYVKETREYFVIAEIEVDDNDDTFLWDSVDSVDFEEALFTFHNICN